jgi:hypothetical protein
LVDKFRDDMKNIPLGLPVIVLQSAKITEKQGLYIPQNIVVSFLFYFLSWLMFF